MGEDHPIAWYHAYDGGRAWYTAGGHTRESYGERNVRAALLDGLAVRVMLPGVDSTRFVREFDPADTAWRWCVYRPDGALRVARAGDLARILAAGALRGGAAPPASPR